MSPGRTAVAGQLDLAFAVESHAALPSRIAPMVPGSGDAPFDDEGWFFEPWWPGDPAIALVSGSTIRMTLGHLADPMVAFPELHVIPSQLGVDGCALSGLLLVLDADGRPDRELLRRRLVDPDDLTGSAAFVASDLLYVGGRSIGGWPFAQRRARLLELLRDGDTCVVNRGLRGEGQTLADAAASMGLGSIGARRLSARWRSGPAGDDYRRLPVLRPPAADTRPMLVLLQRLPLDT